MIFFFLVYWSTNKNWLYDPKLVNRSPKVKTYTRTPRYTKFIFPIPSTLTWIGHGSKRCFRETGKTVRRCARLRSGTVRRYVPKLPRCTAWKRYRFLIPPVLFRLRCCFVVRRPSRIHNGRAVLDGNDARARIVDLTHASTTIVAFELARRLTTMPLRYWRVLCVRSHVYNDVLFCYVRVSITTTTSTFDAQYLFMGKSGGVPEGRKVRIWITRGRNGGSEFPGLLFQKYLIF